MTTVQDSPPRGQGLAGFAEMLRRRKTLALVPFLLVLAAIASLAWSLPSLWTGRATIMIDRQQIPEAFVKSTVTSDIESRLLTLSQEILTRARLMEIVERHDLYPKLRQTATPDDVVERMRKDIKIELSDDRDKRPRESRTSVFGVVYSTTDPVIAMQVANTL